MTDVVKKLLGIFNENCGFASTEYQVVNVKDLTPDEIKVVSDAEFWKKLSEAHNYTTDKKSYRGFKVTFDQETLVHFVNLSGDDGNETNNLQTIGYLFDVSAIPGNEIIRSDFDKLTFVMM